MDDAEQSTVDYGSGEMNLNAQSAQNEEHVEENGSPVSSTSSFNDSTHDESSSVSKYD